MRPSGRGDCRVGENPYCRMARATSSPSNTKAHHKTVMRSTGSALRPPSECTDEANRGVIGGG